MLQTARPDLLPMRPAARARVVGVDAAEPGSLRWIIAVSAALHIGALLWAAYGLPHGGPKVIVDPADLVRVVHADVALPKPPEPPPAVVPPPEPIQVAAALVEPVREAATPEKPKRKTRKRRKRAQPTPPAPFESEQAREPSPSAEAPPASVPAMPLAAGAGSVEVPSAPPASGEADSDGPVDADAPAGDGEGVPDGVLLGGYGERLRRRVARQQRYPGEAMDEGWTGTVEIEVRVARDGSLVGSPKVVRSSGHVLLDREAVRMVRAAAPFTALPQGLRSDVATLNVPIVFELEDEDF